MPNPSHAITTSYITLVIDPRTIPDSPRDIPISSEPPDIPATANSSIRHTSPQTTPQRCPPHSPSHTTANTPLPSQQTTAIKSIKALAPLLDRVLVQRIKAETKTAGGIFLPESAVKELNEAKVLAVGPGAVRKDGGRVEMGVREGDRVLIPQVCLVLSLLELGDGGSKGGV